MTGTAAAAVLSDPRFAIAAFEPGRFANMIRTSGAGRHAAQVVRETSKSSIILALTADGSASLCRGWRILALNDGRSASDAEQIREQLGYRGRWRAAGLWLEIELELNDSVCPRIAFYSHLVPRHAARWQLRAAMFNVQGHPRLRSPVLICLREAARPEFGEDEPHIAAPLLDGRSMILGPGSGLEIEMVKDPTGATQPDVTRVRPAASPISVNEWDTP